MQIMAPNFQSSFIPKEPVTEEVFKKKKAGAFGVLAISLFIISIIVSVAMFVYKGILENEIKNLESQLVESEKSIDKKTINEMSQFSKKLEVVKSIVFKHQIMSKFLESLASSTVSSVYFTGFNYQGLADKDLSVALQGKAQNYTSIALQENVLNQNKDFKSATFSNLSLDGKGFVSFDLKIYFDPKVLIYTPQTQI